MRFRRYTTNVEVCQGALRMFIIESKMLPLARKTDYGNASETRSAGPEISIPALILVPPPPPP